MGVHNKTENPLITLSECKMQGRNNVKTKQPHLHTVLLHPHKHNKSQVLPGFYAKWREEDGERRKGKRKGKERRWQEEREIL